jgi:hypothetical protein
MLVVGDRAVSELPACVGGPATTVAGVFGIVTSCDPGRTPLVTLLRQARPFISYHIPALAASPTLSPLTLVERDVVGPALEIPCAGLSAGEIDVPLLLARDERLLNVAPALVHSQEVRVGEISVIRSDALLAALSDSRPVGRMEWR